MFSGIGSSALYRGPWSTSDTNRRIDLAGCFGNGRPGATLYVCFKSERLAGALPDA